MEYMARTLLASLPYEQIHRHIKFGIIPITSVSIIIIIIRTHLTM